MTSSLPKKHGDTCHWHMHIIAHPCMHSSETCCASACGGNLSEHRDTEPVFQSLHHPNYFWNLWCHDQASKIVQSVCVSIISIYLSIHPSVHLPRHISTYIVFVARLVEEAKPPSLEKSQVLLNISLIHLLLPRSQAIPVSHRIIR